MHSKNLPSNWKWVKVEDVTLPVKKVQPKNDPKKPFVYIDISSIDNNIQKIIDHKEYIGKDAPSRARQLIRKNDVLFSTVRTYLMNIAYVPDFYDGQIASTGFSVLRSKEIVNPKFLYYYCLTQEFLEPLNSLQRGTSYPAVRDGDVRAQPFPLAPLDEQKDVVSKIEELFSQLDAGVAGLKRAQAALKRYRASVLKAAFEGRLVPRDPNDEPAKEILYRMGKESIVRDELIPLPENWAWITLGSVTHPERNRVQPSDHPNAKYIGMADVESMTMKLLSTRLASEMKSTAESFKAGDVLYGSLRPYLNKVICPHFDGLCSTEFIVFPQKPYLNNDYLRIFLSTSEFVSYSNSLNTGDRPRVKFEQFKDYPFPYPPIKEQERIVNTLEKHISIIRSLNDMIAENLERTQTIKQAILSRAFKGKLMDDKQDASTKIMDVNDELENTKEQKIFIQESFLK